MKSKFFHKVEFWIATIYLLITVICFLFEYHPNTESNDYFFALIFLTLPWSIITFFVIMGAIHGGFEYQAAILFFSITAILNAVLIYLFIGFISIKIKANLNEESD